MKVNQRLLILVALLVVVAGWAGWMLIRPAESGGLLEVSGSVTNHGEPVEAGSIQFTPDRNTSGPSARGMIVNGRYRIAAVDGVYPGTYDVQISLGQIKSPLDIQREVREKRKSIAPRTVRWTQPVEIRADATAAKIDFDLSR